MTMGKVTFATKPKSERKKGNNVLARTFFRFVRWTLVIGYFSFVVRGWYMSFDKFGRGQTSISLVKNESKRFTYPSVTFCPMFRQTVRVTHDILDQNLPDSCKHRCGKWRDWKYNCQCMKNCKNQCCSDYEELCTGNDTSVPADSSKWTLDDIDLEQSLDSWSWKRWDFLTAFSHSENGNPRKGVHVLYNDSYWTESVPHIFDTGRCYTYNPPFDNSVGWWYGIRFGLKLPGPGMAKKKQEEKERLLKERMHIFIHQKGQFYFTDKSDFPSSKKLDVSWLKYNRETNINLKYTFTTNLNKEESECNDDPNYDFPRCIDLWFYEDLGCQPPWNAYNDSQVPVCQNVTTMKELYDQKGSRAHKNYNRPAWSYLATSQTTKCPMPCTTATIKPEFSYTVIGPRDSIRKVDKDADWPVHVYFKDYMFAYEAEYRICDWTCLIGEIGGNLGFFLGGSILAFSDILLRNVQDKVLG